MRIYVTPRAGLKVRNPMRPADGYLPADGKAVEDGSAWRRLEKAGDVTIGKEPKAAPKSSKAPDKK